MEGIATSQRQQQLFYQLFKYLHVNIVTFVDCNFVQWQCLFYSPQKLFRYTIDIPCYHSHQSRKPTGMSQLPLQDSMSCRYHQHFLVHLPKNV